MCGRIASMLMLSPLAAAIVASIVLGTFGLFELSAMRRLLMPLGSGGTTRAAAGIFKEFAKKSAAAVAAAFEISPEDEVVESPLLVLLLADEELLTLKLLDEVETPFSDCPLFKSNALELAPFPSELLKKSLGFSVISVKYNEY